MGSRTSLAVLVACALVVSGYGRADAARLEKLDERNREETTPPQGQDGTQPTCTGSAFADANASAGGNAAAVSAETAASVLSDDPSCDVSATGAAAAGATFTIAADAGENPGDAIMMCYHALREMEASDSGGAFNAEASYGGNFPPTTPAAITLNLGAVTVFSDGPLSISDGRNRREFVRQFSANIGDEIDLVVATGSQASGMGVGSARAAAFGSLEVTVGPCTEAGAPAMSGAALAALAVALAGFGAMRLRSRRRQWS